MKEYSCIGCHLYFPEDELREGKFCITCFVQVIRRYAGIPSRFLKASLSDLDFLGKEKLNQLFRGFYVHGPVGSGKTHAVCALANYFIEQGKCRVLFKEYVQLMREVKATFDGGEESESSIAKRLQRAPVLIIDDMGGLNSDKQSEYWVRFMEDVINYRYNEFQTKDLRTFITSNKSLDQLAKDFDDRIASRIRGMCYYFLMPGKDRRINEFK